MKQFKLTSPTGEVYYAQAETLEEAIAKAQRGEASETPIEATPAEVEPAVPAAPEGTQASPDEPVQFRGQFLPGLIGLGEMGLQGLTAGAGMVAGGLSGLATMLPGGIEPAQAVEDVSDFFTYQPRTPEAQRMGAGIGGLMEPLTEATDIAGEYVSEATGFPAAGALTRTILEGGPAVMGGRGMIRRGGRLREANAPPSVDELFKTGKQSARNVKDAGVTLDPGRTGMVTQRISARLDEMGIDPTLEPKASAVFERLLDDVTRPEPLTFEEAYRVRRIAGRAMADKNPGEVTFAGIIRDELDDFLENLTPDDVIGGVGEDASRNIRVMKDAWRRARTGEEIEGLIERAGVRAGQFSGSGYENALRTEFRQLAMNENRMRRLPKEVQEAVKKVAMGDSIDNALRFLGKFAPTGVVSTLGAGGLGAYLFGTPGAIAVPAAGAAARGLATRRTIGNAQLASEIARRGRLEPEPIRPSAVAQGIYRQGGL